MVKIAIAGGSGQVAKEVIDALVSANKHEIIILSRTAVPSSEPGLTSRAVDYNNKSQLVEVLQGIDTVLSFIQLLSDPGNTSQRNLIDAAIIAGVKRFAPSEWGSAETNDMPWWTGKGEVREYLKKLNEKKKVLEYCLFQPGLFLDYLAYPYKTSKHVSPLGTMFDFQHRRAIAVDGYDFVMTFTAVQDLAQVVALAVEYVGEWPVVGGIRGNRLTASEIFRIGEKVRSQPLAIETMKLEDLEAGELKTSWTLEAKHSAVSEEQALQMFKTVLIGTLLGGVKRAWDVGDELNQMFPEYEFAKAETFLSRIWEGKE